MMQSTTSARSHDRHWWKEAIVYQIYPSSFYDSNGDGIGDIPGVIEKLPYLAALGIDCIWLSPHYASPQIDMGYDISNYENIYPPYGTLEQTQQLIDASHAHKIKIIFDLVINHTSAEHAWFKESRSSKSNPKRDWYFWKPPRGWKDGKPLAPNNWRSIFAGPAWEFDERTQEFYLHLFATEMPDLNWENAETRKAIYESSMRFWLKRGIDGFRVDVVNKYSKQIDFADAPVIDPHQYEQPCSKLNSNGPRMHEFLSEMNDVLSQYRTFDGGEIMTVGELPNTPLEGDVRAYVSAAKKQLGMVFNFDTVGLGKTHADGTVIGNFRPKDMQRTLSMWQTFVDGTDAWTTVFLENHDQGRSISRFGDDSSETTRIRSGKLLATVLASMTGTLFIYQGQEIGMVNMPSSWSLAEYKDVWAVNLMKQLELQGASPARIDSAMVALRKLARDHSRTPMQWDDSPHAGFCPPNAAPWMRVHDNFPTLNVKEQTARPDSLLNLWTRLVALRKQYRDAFVYGSFSTLDRSSSSSISGSDKDEGDVPKDDDDVFAFVKTAEDGTKTLTVANMSGRKVPWRRPQESKLLLSNYASGDGEGDGDGEEEDQNILRPWEARISLL